MIVRDLERCYTGVEVPVGRDARFHWFDGRLLVPLTPLRLHPQVRVGWRNRLEAENTAFTLLGDFLLRHGDARDISDLAGPLADAFLPSGVWEALFIPERRLVLWLRVERMLRK